MRRKPTLSLEIGTLRRNLSLLLRSMLLVALYLTAFIILDLSALQFEELRGIVAWYPPAGLTYALLLVFGIRFTPAVTIAYFIGSLYVYRMPQPLPLLFLWASIISLIYGAAAALLRRRIRLDWQLRRFRDVIWLIVLAVLVSAMLAALSVSGSALSSREVPRAEVLKALFHWWIGEMVGVLAITPFLLTHVMPWLKRFVDGQPLKLPPRWSFPRLTLSVIGQVASFVFVLTWVFATSVLDEFRPLYLIILPFIWIVLDHGFKGATIGTVVLSFCVTSAMLFSRVDLAYMGELQLLMIVICITGLLMGAVVTERKRAEEALKEYSERLEEMVEERTRELRDAQEQLVRREKLAVLGQLAGGVGHELRNPLGVISNSVYFLQMLLTDADGAIQEYLGIIGSEVRNAGKIVSDLLDLSRTRQTEREDVDLSVLAAEVLLEQPPSAGIEVTTLFAADLPFVFVDRLNIRQVLTNLVSNAFLAMPDGGELVLSARVDGCRVRLSVADSGCGIPSENMAKIFEPLFTTRARGIGLGLAVSKNLVQVNGGTIEVQSEEGKGSTFTVALPVREVGL